MIRLILNKTDKVVRRNSRLPIYYSRSGIYFSNIAYLQTSCLPQRLISWWLPRCGASWIPPHSLPPALNQPSHAHTCTKTLSSHSNTQTQSHTHYSAILNERHKAERGSAPALRVSWYRLLPRTTKNALFKCWTFMAGDTEGRGQRPGHKERVSWSVGSKTPVSKYYEMHADDLLRYFSSSAVHRKTH